MWTLAFKFLGSQWKAIAIGLVVGFVWLWLNGIINERDEAVLNLKTTTDLIRDNAVKAEAEKALIAKLGNEQRKKDQAEAIRNAQIIGNAYYSMVKEAKDETKHIKIDSVATADKLRDKLREQSAIIASRSLPGDDSVPSARIDGISTIPGRTEEESAEFYRTAYAGAIKDLRMCKLSGASCASDFNECRAYVLGEQSRIGVTESQ